MNNPRLMMQRSEVSGDKDRIVQQTDVDALQSRCSAVNAGYLNDPFANLFLEAAGGPEKPKRYPLINRGTYVRTASMDMLVERFLRGCRSESNSKQRQVISLGAGSDTRFFRIASSFINASSSSSSTTTLPFLYHELDFPAVTSRKIAAISRHKALSTILSHQSVSGSQGFAVGRNGSALTSESYRIHPVDLRTLKPGAALLEGIDPSLPTLVLSECCLIYLSPQEADDIIRWISDSFMSHNNGGSSSSGASSSSTALGIIIYEPIGGDDPFGKVMIRNLAARGIVLRTLMKYSNLIRQRERLRVLVKGATKETTGACDVNFIHDTWVDDGERERMDKLEMLDEREEWVLLAKHYCVAWGWRDSGGGEEANGKLFEAWKELVVQQTND